MSINFKANVFAYGMFMFLALQGAMGKNFDSTLDSLITLGFFKEAISELDKQLTSEKNSSERLEIVAYKISLLAMDGRLGQAVLEMNNSGFDTLPFLSPSMTINLAQLHLFTGNYEKCLLLLDKNDSLMREKNSLQADLLDLKGVGYWSLMNYSMAIDVLNQAVNLKKSEWGQSSIKVAKSLQNLALVMQNNDPKKSKSLYFEALKLYNNANIASCPALVSLNENIALMYFSERKTDSCEIYHKKAMDMAERVYQKEHPTKAFILNNMGRLDLENKNFERANTKFLVSLGIYERLYGKNHPEVANTYLLLAQSKEEQRKYSLALSHVNQCFETISIPSKWKSENRLPLVKEVNDQLVFLAALITKAKIHENKHFANDLKRKDLFEALDCYQKADTVIFEIRKKLTHSKDKLVLNSQAREVYENAIAISLALKEVSFNKKKWDELAFYFCEKSKAYSLLEALNDNKAKKFSDLPDHLIEEESQLKTEIALLERLLLEPSANASDLQMQLQKQLASLKAFTKKIEREYPRYYQLKYALPFLTVKELSSMYQDNELGVDFLISSHRKEIYVFLVESTGLSVQTIQIEDDFDKIVKSLRNSILYRNDKVYGNRAYQLHEKIIKPLRLEKSNQKLLLIPDGILYSIPFETLLSQKPPKSGNYQDYPFLLKSFAITYGYSLQLNALERKERMATESKLIFCMAPSQFKSAASLPGTLLEIDEISSLFKKEQVVQLKGEEANLNNLKAISLQNFKYLHFATHGLVDEEEADRSRLYFFGRETEDFLYASDVYALKLNADLVCLSACQTGLGKLSKGEGLLGLSRAFAYAGARNMVVSLWNVSDQVAIQLFKRFYELLLKGDKDISESLQASKLYLLENLETSSPYLWAPFIHIGR